MHRVRTALALPLLSLTLTTQAAEGLGAHVHGEARLQAAIDGQSIDLMLESPAYNLVGFEHAPENDAQQASVDEARQWLESTPLLSAAGCTLADASASHTLDEHGHDDGHEGHEDHHDEEHAHEHEHEHEHEKHEGEHAEFEVSQRLTCDESPLAGEIGTPLFDRFEALERLDVEWVSDQGQGAVTLSGDQTRFSFE